MERFRLAPMTTDLRAMTFGLYALPLVFLAAAIPASPARAVLIGTAVFILVLYAYVWLRMRPSRFEVGPEGLRIVWPTHSQQISASSIVAVEELGRQEFIDRYGWGIRIGAGGLWGGFGRFKTPQATFSLYTSRTDRYVVVQRTEGLPLMLTPETPERFVAALTPVAGLPQ